MDTRNIALGIASEQSTTPTKLWRWKNLINWGDEMKPYNDAGGQEVEPSTLILAAVILLIASAVFLLGGAWFGW